MSEAEENYYRLLNDENYLQSLHQKEDMCDVCEKITHTYVEELENQKKKMLECMTTVYKKMSCSRISYHFLNDLQQTVEEITKKSIEETFTNTSGG